MIKLQTDLEHLRKVHRNQPSRNTHSALVAHAYQEAVAFVAGTRADADLVREVDERVADKLKEWGVENG